MSVEKLVRETYEIVSLICIPWYVLSCNLGMKFVLLPIFALKEEKMNTYTILSGIQYPKNGVKGFHIKSIRVKLFVYKNRKSVISIYNV